MYLKICILEALFSVDIFEKWDKIFRNEFLTENHFLDIILYFILFETGLINPI